MKLIKSHCANRSCPFKECERHHVNNKDRTEEYNFEGTCKEFRKYFAETLNGKIKKTQKDN